MKHGTKTGPKPKTVGEYLAGLDAERRVALIKIRKAVRSAVPGIAECISYGLPAFRVNGKYFVGFGATSKGCSFYLGSTVRSHSDKLKGFDVDKGTIRFNAKRPPTTSLVKLLVKARITENPRFNGHA